MELEDRISLAVDFFRQGYNCAQSVTAAFADLYGLTHDQALRVSASFGGGVGRMRGICGAASGMFILAGLECGSVEAHDPKGKEYNYSIVQQLAAKFKERNGSLICGELLGLVPLGSSGMTVPPHGDSPVPEARTEGYYKKRPCAGMVEEGARIFVEYLLNKQGVGAINVK
ncbi:MAG: C_GCAxxG_C_C family protein [Bacteroidaceae bacterium]|nr:C_GCAxxG_C_C family protein [Bacteroidaceae bacterium]